MTSNPFPYRNPTHQAEKEKQQQKILQQQLADANRMIAENAVLRDKVSAYAVQINQLIAKVNDLIKTNSELKQENQQLMDIIATNVPKPQ